MQLITDKAEEKLAAALRQESRGGCLHVRGALFAKDVFAGLPEQLIRWLGAETEGSLYVCQDRDIFILMPEVTLDLLAELRLRLFDSFPDVTSPDVVYYYALPIMRDEVTALINVKLARRTAEAWAEEERARSIEREIRRERILTSFPDKNLHASLASRRTARRKTRVLIVDDDSALCELLESVLHGHAEIVSCGDGASAVSRHLETAPDLVFLDIDLPDISGHDVLEKIIDLDPKVDVVMLSGKDSDGNVRRATDAGAKGFIGKPFAVNRMLDYISQYAKPFPGQLKGA